MFWNTCILTFPQLIGQFLLASPAAWAFSRFTFRGRNLLFTIYTILMLLPFQVLMVPDYLVLDRLGLMDTVWSIILPGAVSTFPVFIMKKGFDGIPVSVLEAAELDGAGAITTYIRIGLPLGIPGILSALLLSFIEAWNAIEQPLVFLKSQNLWPMSLFLANITQDDIGIAMVASVFMLLPVILIFLFGQRYLILGIQSSGVPYGILPCCSTLPWKIQLSEKYSQLAVILPLLLMPIRVVSSCIAGCFPCLEIGLFPE